MRPLLEGCHLPVAHLMQDPARVLVAEVVKPGALAQSQFSKCCRRQLRGERQCLQAGEDAVATEHRHEPRQARRREAATSCRDRRETQRGEIDEAASVTPLKRLPLALEPWGFVQPAPEILGHVCRRTGRLPGERSATFASLALVRFEKADRYLDVR